jgi:predicted DNA helicase
MRQRKGRELPETEIGVGDLVMLSRDDPERPDNPTGTVAEMTGYSVTVAFAEPPASFLTGRDLRMDLYVNDVTFQRMKDALDALREADGRLREMRDQLTGVSLLPSGGAAEIDRWGDEDLNRPQRRAVRRAVGSDSFHLIHGPPGTGKTTAAVEVIRQEVRRGRRVLATAASNVAVDNVLEFLLREGVAALRVGHPARVTPALRERTLDALVEEHPEYRRSRQLRDEAFELKARAEEELTRPSGRYRRGMSDERIRELAERGRGSRGVPEERIREMAEFLEAREEIDRLFEESRALEDAAVRDVLDRADVVCTTNSTAGSELLEDESFDVLVLDEATQATEPSCLIPLVRADRAVLAGDHRQLPPTVLSREAREEGLDVTLFERLARRGEDRITDTLTVQYRMHREIMEFPNRRFYDDALRAHETVARHTLWDLELRPDRIDGRIWPLLDPEAPLVFLDTGGAAGGERSRPGSSSRENPLEAELVVRAARSLVDAGLSPRAVGIIAPYADQVRLVRRSLEEPDLEVHTVDGFQGREKEAILLSLTRSNERGEVGFLRDARRLNVALTRARRKLLVVGDASTLAGEPIFADLVEHCRASAGWLTLSGSSLPLSDELAGET